MCPWQIEHIFVTHINMMLLQPTVSCGLGYLSTNRALGFIGIDLLRACVITDRAGHSLLRVRLPGTNARMGPTEYLGHGRDLSGCLHKHRQRWECLKRGVVFTVNKSGSNSGKMNLITNSMKASLILPFRGPEVKLAWWFFEKKFLGDRSKVQW